MILPTPPFRIGLIGAGSVGTAVATLLARSGHVVTGVASRSRGSAERASQRLAAPIVAPADLNADVFLIGTGLDSVPAVTEELSSGPLEGKVICHFAGAAGIEPLASATERGAAACAIHPVQACPDVDTGIARLPGSAWGLTCSEGATRWAERMVTEDLSGRRVIVPEPQRAAWHAASVITSNGIAGLLATGEALLTELGIEDPELVLGPLARGTVQNAIEGGGGARTLTGPVVRGEVDTIRRHLAALHDAGREYSDAYRFISRYLILTAARHADRLDEAQAEAIGDVLER